MTWESGRVELPPLTSLNVFMYVTEKREACVQRRERHVCREERGVCAEKREACVQRRERCVCREERGVCAEKREVCAQICFLKHIDVHQCHNLHESQDASVQAPPPPPAVMVYTI